MSSLVFVFLSSLVFWAGCGIRLYRFLIVAFYLLYQSLGRYTFANKCVYAIEIKTENNIHNVIHRTRKTRFFFFFFFFLTDDVKM